MTDKKEPKICVIMATYFRKNGTTKNLLSKALINLEAQTYKNFKLFLIGDHYDNNDEFEALQIGDIIQVEIRKSRFQIHDPFILSIGVFLSRADVEGIVQAPVNPVPDLPAPASALPPVMNDEEDDDALAGDETLLTVA